MRELSLQEVLGKEIRFLPSFFVIAMDYLSMLLNHLEERNAITCVVLSENCSFNHHLLFANDILSFVRDDDDSLKNLQMALGLFERGSGLKFNEEKSTISSFNIAPDRAKLVAEQWRASLIRISLFLTWELH